MYRVELKDFRAGWQTCAIANVPNVQCGVESCKVQGFTMDYQEKVFLMYRVELKVSHCL